MTTKFYDALQLDPSILKRRIAACETKKEKTFYRAAMAVRSALIVAFAILFISLLSGLFGADNTPMAVALFCMLLGIRFVNFEYCAGDSLAGLAAALARRGLMALAGWLVCGAILLAKHRGRHADTRFHHLVRRFRLSRPECLWQLHMAPGVSLVLAAGQVFGVERFMWMGFACGSLLSEYPLPGGAAVRFWQRIAGAAAGCAAFALLYLALPEGLRPLLGPLGGFCMGFCTDYRYKTAMNCFGALMIGAGLYGLSGAVALRLADTVLGAAFGLCFAALFHRLSRRLLPAADPAL